MYIINPFDLIKKIINFLIISYSSKGKAVDKAAKYTIVETYKNSKNKQIIVAKIEDTPKSVFVMPATELTMRKRHLLQEFAVSDIVNIVALAASEKEPLIIETRKAPYNYYTLVAMLFGSILVVSNILSSKLISIFGFTMTGGQLIFPFSYFFDDVLTEVYGYKRSRQLIWGAVFCCVVFIIFAELTIAMPPSPYWHYQHEFADVIGAVPRVIIASLLGYFVGEFVNSYTLAKMKIIDNGGYLWKRVIVSSMFSLFVSISIFTFVAFWGTLSASESFALYLRIITYSLAYEIVAFPVTYYLINFLKKKEGIDIYDNNTNFNPFSLDVEYRESANKWQQNASSINQYQGVKS